MAQVLKNILPDSPNPGGREEDVATARLRGHPQGHPAGKLKSLTPTLASKMGSVPPTAVTQPPWPLKWAGPT